MGLHDHSELFKLNMDGHLVGMWIAVPACSLIILLVWIMQGLNLHDNQQQWNVSSLVMLVVIAFLIVMPIVLTLGITPARVQKLFYMFSPSEQQNSSNGSKHEGSPFELLNTVVAVVALFVAFVPFALSNILRAAREDVRIEREASERLRREIEIEKNELRNEMEDEKNLLRSESIETRLLVYNEKCYSYFNRLFQEFKEDEAGKRKEIQAIEKLLEFFDIPYENEVQLVINIQQINSLEMESQLSKKKEAKEYLRRLGEYHQANCPELYRYCHELFTRLNN